MSGRSAARRCHIRMFNRTTWIILAIAVGVGLALVASRFIVGAGTASTTAPQTRIVRLLPQPRDLPDFSLQQSDGTPLIPGELHGHWTLVFLGFTFCPDICPTTLTELAQAQKQWQSLPEAVRPRVLFVSVDPERDSPDRIGEYAHAFHPDTLAATGDIPSLERFATSLSLVFMKAPPPAGAPADQYSVDHSAAIAVLDPQGRMAGVIPPPLDPQAIAADLLALTEATSP